MNSPFSYDLDRRLASLAAARHLLVCSDYDGTLAPLARHPEQAQLLTGAFDVLHHLSRLPDTRVAIISGRSLANLRAHSGLEQPVLLVGSHGAELPDYTAGIGDLVKQNQLDALESMLRHICAPVPGAWLERKPLGIAVHVREVSETNAERVLAEVRDKLVDWPMVYATEGKAIIDLSLSRTGKGDAVRWLRDDWGTNPQVLYMGDDVTDEAAFGALAKTDLGVKIGAGLSVAEYRLPSESAALSILTFLWQRRTAMLTDAIEPNSREIAEA